jgi:hypothetical protein
VQKQEENAVKSLPDFLLSISKTTLPPGKYPGSMSIVIQRPHTHLENELRKAFEGQEEINIIVDRRYGERRVSQQPVSKDRRRADRRKAKALLAEAVIFVED